MPNSCEEKNSKIDREALYISIITLHLGREVVKTSARERARLENTHAVNPATISKAGEIDRDANCLESDGPRWVAGSDAFQRESQWWRIGTIVLARGT